MFQPFYPIHKGHFSVHTHSRTKDNYGGTYIKEKYIWKKITRNNKGNNFIPVLCVCISMSNKEQKEIQKCCRMCGRVCLLFYQHGQKRFGIALIMFAYHFSYAIYIFFSTNYTKKRYKTTISTEMSAIPFQELSKNE